MIPRLPSVESFNVWTDWSFFSVALVWYFKWFCHCRTRNLQLGEKLSVNSYISIFCSQYNCLKRKFNSSMHISPHILFTNPLSEIWISLIYKGFLSDRAFATDFSKCDRYFSEDLKQKQSLYVISMTRGLLRISCLYLWRWPDFPTFKTLILPFLFLWSVFISKPLSQLLILITKSSVSIIYFHPIAIISI